MDDVFSAVCSGLKAWCRMMQMLCARAGCLCISVGEFLYDEAAICCNGRVNRWVVGLFATIAASCGLVL